MSLEWDSRMIFGSLSKDVVVDSKDVIWQFDFAFLQTFLNYSKSFILEKFKICGQGQVMACT